MRLPPGRSPPWVVGLLLLLLQLSPWLACMTQAQLAVEVHVSTGQELADAVAAWGATGWDTTIYVDVPFISLRNVTFTNASSLQPANSAFAPFSKGTLTLKGQPATISKPATILDTGMRADLIPGVSGSAKCEVYNMIMLNLCELPLVALGIALPPAISTPFNLGLFGGSSLSTNRKLTNITMYGRHAAFILSNYAAILQRTLIPDIRDIAANLIGMSGLLGAASDEFSPYVQGVKDMTTADTIWENFTMISLDNPSDPLLNLLKAQNRLMPPQFCSGQPHPDQVTSSAYLMWAPLWMTDSQPTFTAGLQQATARTSLPMPVKGLPVILSHSKTRVVAHATDTYNVSNRFLLTSPAAGTLQSYNQLIPLDMNGRVGLLNILPAGQLMLQFLALTGLAAKVPTQLPASLAALPTSSLQPSVFPLAAFTTSNSPDTWANSSQILLANVTLVIPPDDYLAMLLMAAPSASSACVEPRIHELGAQIKAGISQVQFTSTDDLLLQQPIDKGQGLLIRSLVGWGMNATLLRLVPSAPVVLPVCRQTSKPAALSTEQVIGIAVGVSVGLALCALLAAIAVWRHKQLSRQAASSTYSTPSSGHHTTCTYPFSSKLPHAPNSGNTSTDEYTSGHTGTVPTSALSAFLQHASASRHRLFESGQGLGSVDDLRVGDPSPVVSRNWARTPGVYLEDEQRMRDQVKIMSDKLQQESDQLVLSAVLGSGNCGTVFMGTWRGLRVAVKTFIFHEHEDNSTGILPHGTLVTAHQRAVMETAIAASVGHKNLVATYHYDIKPLVPQHDTAVEGGLKIKMAAGSNKTEHNAYKLFLIQELCDSSLLYAIQQKLICRAGPGLFPMADLITVLADMASGLSYLHSLNIIHGDLKPENVLLKVDKSSTLGVAAKLTDFGLSTRLGPGDTHVSNYNSGTPFYVAPEVTQHHRLSTASDMYSFGVICWEMYTGQAPFIRTDTGFVWNTQFPNFTAHDLPPPEFHLLCCRCLQHKPQIRPTAREAADTLHSMLSSIFAAREGAKAKAAADAEACSSAECTASAGDSQ